MDTHTVTIEKCAEQPVYNGVSKKTQRPYEVHTWSCSGKIDGDDVGSFVVKVLGAQGCSDVHEGATLQCERNEFNGKVSFDYKAPQQAAGGFRGAPRPKYTQEEYEALFLHACKFVLGNLTKDDYLSKEQCIPLISTYIIGAQGSGIKPTK